MPQTFKLANDRSVTVPDNWQPEIVVNPSGYIFTNAKGGPYKYGYALLATRQNLRLVEAGLL